MVLVACSQHQAPRSLVAVCWLLFGVICPMVWGMGSGWDFRHAGGCGFLVPRMDTYRLLPTPLSVPLSVPGAHCVVPLAGGR